MTPAQPDILPVHNFRPIHMMGRATSTQRFYQQSARMFTTSQPPEKDLDALSKILHKFNINKPIKSINN